MSTGITRTPRQGEWRIVIVPIVLVSISYLSIVTFGAFTLPWTGTADSYDHLDYVFQVYLGHLPAPTGHQWVPIGFPLTAGQLGDGRQYASAHPPLFYLIAAGLAGWLLDSPHWSYGVLLIRMLNGLFGLIGVVVLAWAGWVLGGRHRYALSVALPSIGAFTFAYLRFSSDVYNDLLVTVLSMSALTLSAVVLIRGMTRARFLSLTLICIAVMGTKATFVLTLAASVVAVVVAVVLHGNGTLRRRTLTASGSAALLLAAPIVVFGWFYARNASLSGSWYRSAPKSPVGSRSDKTLLGNLANPEFYEIVPSGLVGRGTAEFARLADLISWDVFIVGTLMSLIVALLILRKSRRRPSIVEIGLVTMFLGHLVGSYVIQLSHATGFGAYNWRYFLPSTISVALIIGGGAALIPRAGPALVAMLNIALWAANAYSFVVYAAHRVGIAGDDFLGTASLLSAANGAPPWIPAVALVIAGLATLGACATSYALFASKTRQRPGVIAPGP